MKAKNIGLLATLAMVVTVGGVYATWNYATTSPTEKTITGLGFNITEASGTKKGDLKAALAANYSITIENNGSYVPVIEWTDTDSVAATNNVKIDVGFKPHESYEAEFGKSITLKAAISFTGNTWNDGSADHAIFTVPAAKSFTIDWTSLTADGDGYYNTTVDIAELFVLESTKLDTADKHGYYKTGLTATSATITISE